MKAFMEHTRDSCVRLALVQEKCYGRTRTVIRGIIGMIPIVTGLCVGLDRTRGVLLVVLGILIYYSTSYMYEKDAEKAFNMTSEQFRKVDYHFFDEGFDVISGGQKKRLGYDDIISLISDGTYLYLFINTQQAYAMKPLGNVNEFKDYLSEHTKKQWRNVRTRESFLRVMRRSFTERK